MAAPVLVLEGIYAAFSRNMPVLRGVSLTALPGKLTVVLGPNGAGKSTLLKVASGFLQQTAGTVTLDGRDISAEPPYARLGLGVGSLAQGRSVFPELTVAQNLELGGWLLRGDRNRLRDALEATLARYSSLRDLRGKPAGSLSGGQQRLLEIARLMVAQPLVLLIDEPSAGLSPDMAADVYRELERLKAEGRTLLLVDQNIRAAVAIADHVYLLRDGTNERQGDGASFHADPRSPVRSWLGDA